MLSNTKSNSKKVFVSNNNTKTKPKIGTQSTDTGATFMRRYKSQENYLITGKKFKTNSTSNIQENTCINGTNGNNASNFNNLITSTNSINMTNLSNLNQSQSNQSANHTQSHNPSTNMVGIGINTINTINSMNNGSTTTSTNFSSLNSPNYKDANNLIYSKSKELISLNSLNSENSSKGNIKKTLSSSNKKKNLSPESNKVQSKMTTYIHSKPKNSNKPAAVSKIINDESIQELNTEENINSQDENNSLLPEPDCETESNIIDPMKSSELISDFYTNSIGEASCSIIDKGKKLINNLPQPFVKCLKSKFVGEYSIKDAKTHEKVQERERDRDRERDLSSNPSNQSNYTNYLLTPNINALTANINICNIDKDREKPIRDKEKERVFMSCSPDRKSANRLSQALSLNNNSSTNTRNFPNYDKTVKKVKNSNLKVEVIDLTVNSSPTPSNFIANSKNILSTTSNPHFNTTNTKLLTSTTGSKNSLKTNNLLTNINNTSTTTDRECRDNDKPNPLNNSTNLKTLNLNINPRSSNLASTSNPSNTSNPSTSNILNICNKKTSSKKKLSSNKNSSKPVLQTQGQGNKNINFSNFSSPVNTLQTSLPNPVINISNLKLNDGNHCSENPESKNIRESTPQLESYQRKLLIASKKGDRDAFLESLEQILTYPKGDVNFKDDSGWTALHHASDEGNLKIVDILINTNADVNCRTNNKKSPLHLAVSHGFFDISKLLAESGGIINSLDDEKNTPIHICSSIGHIELLKYLLDRFPQADAKNIYGKTPYDLAKKEDIKNLILEYLKKNESQYHKVHIHTTNNKSANVMLKNIGNVEGIYNNYMNNSRYSGTCNTYNNPNTNNINTNTNNSSNFSVKTPTKSYNPISNLNNTKNIVNEDSIKNKPHHNKFNPSSDNNNGNGSNLNINQINTINNQVNNLLSPTTPVKTQTPSAFNSTGNNININISTNLSNLNNSNTNKVKVTVETKMNPQGQANTNNTLNLSNSNTNNFSKNNHPNSSIKLNTYNTNRLMQSNKSKNPISENINNTSINLNSNAGQTIRNGNSNTGINTQTFNNTSRNLNSNSIKNKEEITKRINAIESNLNFNKKKSSSSTNHHENTSNIGASDNSNILNTSNPINDLSTSKNIYDPNNSNNLNNTCTYNIINTNPEEALESNDNNNTNNTNTDHLEVSNTNNTLNAFNNTANNIHNKSDSIVSMEDNSNMNNMNSCSIDEERIGPSSFVCHALLGKGSFGEVYLVEKKNLRTLFAMKVLSKDKIMAQNLVKYAMTERNVLSITNHPFIVKLNYSFQTSDKLFLILEYCPGGDLAEHLARENRFTEERAKIYLCEIILALEDLHKRDIIFRDLKPDNVVLDMEGHALLTDFGLSKEGVLDSKGAKSFCGSIAYLAPEMLKRSGHGKAVDWYLLGVLFYEMLVGIPPYFTNNKEQLFKNIEKAELQIPKFVSDDAANLLRALLQRDPLLRLGSGENDAVDVKSHKYFNEVKWEDVYARKLNPPNPAIRNRMIQQFAKPRVFEDNGTPGVFLEMDSHFDGWSFINNDDQQNSLSMMNSAGQSGQRRQDKENDTSKIEKYNC